MSSIAKKLQMKPGQHWLLLNAPDGYLSLLEPLPEGLQISTSIGDKPYGIQVFVKTKSELSDALEAIQSVREPDTILWFIYPKKNLSIPTDLEMMSNWDEPAKYGLRPVGSAAIDKIWTALRFKPQDRTKLTEIRNEAVKNSALSVYVDVVNKKVTLPPEIAALLETNRTAYDNYQKLAYSHKKEYVLWVLSAKQEKTKLDRLNKIVDMLAVGKKNPSAK